MALTSIVMLAGCGMMPVASTLSNQTSLTAKQSTQSAYNQGIEKAYVIFGKKSVTRETPSGTTPSPTFYLGLCRGLLYGAQICNNGLGGASYDVEAYRQFVYMNQKAMEETLKFLKKSPEIETKYQKAIGILEGGIETINSIHGSYNVHQWQSFNDSASSILNKALDALSN